MADHQHGPTKETCVVCARAGKRASARRRVTALLSLARIWQALRVVALAAILLYVVGAVVSAVGDSKPCDAECQNEQEIDICYDNHGITSEC